MRENRVERRPTSGAAQMERTGALIDSKFDFHV